MRISTNQYGKWQLFWIIPETTCCIFLSSGKFCPFYPSFWEEKKKLGSTYIMFGIYIPFSLLCIFFADFAQNGMCSFFEILFCGLVCKGPNTNAHIPRWLPNAKKIDTNNMKYTWPTGAPGLSFGPPGLALAFWIPPCCISNTKWLHWGSKPMRWPSASGFALQWNIGLRCLSLSLFCWDLDSIKGRVVGIHKNVSLQSMVGWEKVL